MLHSIWIGFIDRASFFIGRWEGLALSISSVSIVLSSMICLIIVPAIRFLKKDVPS
nr:YesK family protein [Bacillus pumilus]